MVTADGRIFPADETTSRQRLLAAYRGEPVDRLPYWVKIDNKTWRTSQEGTVRNWSSRELLDFIQADGIFGCDHGVRRHTPHTRQERTRVGNVEMRVTTTPDGELVERWTFDPYTQSWHPTEFPVKTQEDLARFRWNYTDVRIEVDEDALRRSREAIEQTGERGIFKCGWGTSPLMHLVEHVIGPVNVHFMLADSPDEMDELVEQMHQVCLEHVRAVARHTPADLVCSIENTSTTLISPEQFSRYCLRHLREYGRAIEEAGRMHELHMCGHTRVLLGEIDTIPASSIEAYTSPTLGNTRLVDGRTDAPSKTLVGGTNVNVWLWPLERIREYVTEELDACPDTRRIVLTTAGVAPPGCPAEKFRQVGEWLSTVPARN